MRCPKCHYLSFDPEPRCRNCGYNLDLPADELVDGDLELKTPASGDVPPADLILRDHAEPEHVEMPLAARSRTEPEERTETADDVERPRPRGPFDPPEALPARTARGSRTPEVTPRPARPPRPSSVSHHRRAPAVPAPPTTELPLFVTEPIHADADAQVDEEDLVVPEPSVSGGASLPTYPPIAFQRESSIDAPDPEPKTEPRRKLGPLDRDLLEDLQRLERDERPPHEHVIPADEVSATAGAGRRIAAALIDALVLGVVTAAVLAITLRWCELTLNQIGLLPIAPTGAFLLLVGLSYLLMFTAAGGQTLGKMIADIRVIADDGDGPHLSAGQIVLREVVALPSVLLLGAGLLPGLFGDRRAVHDRMSRTRVVRA